MKTEEPHILNTDEVDELVKKMMQGWLDELTRLFLDCVKEENE